MVRGSAESHVGVEEGTNHESSNEAANGESAARTDREIVSTRAELEIAI